MDDKSRSEWPKFGPQRPQGADGGVSDSELR